MTATLEQFANSAAYQTKLENDKKALAAIFGAIPQEFHNSVVFTSAEYNNDYVMGFRLSIDGKRFVAVNSRHYPSIYSIDLYHDGFRFVEKVFKPEMFSRELADEYNSQTLTMFQNLWKILGILLLLPSFIGLAGGGLMAGIIVGCVLSLAGLIVGGIELGKYDDGDFRKGINTPLRDSTLEALSNLRQISKEG